MPAQRKLELSDSVLYRIENMLRGGFSQTDIGKVMGVSQRSISRIIAEHFDVVYVRKVPAEARKGKKR